MVKDILISEFKALLEDNKRNIQKIVELAEAANLTDEQYYINWEDYLNKVSIKDHNK